VLHDLREGSPTQSNTMSFDIGEHNDGGVFIPPGIAHGFVTLEDSTLTYLVDNYYNPADELGVMYNDPAIDAEWGLSDPIVSERDLKNPKVSEIPENRRPYWGMRT
jgi:dTDP-4-dehydrorhamnose 3,5-epimerase